MSIRDFLKRQLVSREVEAIADRVPKPVGSFGYDPWGYNQDAVKIAVSLIKPLSERYFRVEAHGLENIPADGRLLIVGNHSGQLPLDGVLASYAVGTSPYHPRAVRVMIERWFPTIPFVGNILNEVGAVLGDPENCAKMLRNEEAIIVFPEGVRGSGKVYSKRYQLQRFGLGFMHLAITEQAPIVPVGIVGCEETMPTPFHMKAAARLLGMPYLPVTMPVPLPSKVRLYFGEPMHFEGPIVGEEDVAVRVEQVKAAIAKLVQQGLEDRKGKGWLQ